LIDYEYNCINVYFNSALLENKMQDIISWWLLFDNLTTVYTANNIKAKPTLIDNY